MNHRDQEANRRNPHERGQLWTVDGQDAAWREAFAKAAQMRQYELSNEDLDDRDPDLVLLDEVSKTGVVAVYCLIGLAVVTAGCMLWAFLPMFAYWWGR